MKTLLVFSCALVTVFGKNIGAENVWNDLRVTFGVNPLNTWDFDELPRDLHGNMQNFALKDDQCSSAASGMFRGTRYWYKQDPATILIFDVNGYIAGIQTSVPSSSGWIPYSPQLGTYVLDEGDSFTMTVYFVDPSIICTTGRSASDFASQGTGTDLYIQNGMDPTKNFFQVPKMESDIKLTKWGFGKCFYGMGQHYWHNVSKDMTCQDFVPYCLLYNNGVLNAFCFHINADVQPSQRYEHATNKVSQSFIDPVPDCFYSDPSFKKISTLHVYLTSNYLADRC